MLYNISLETTTETTTTKTLDDIITALNNTLSEECENDFSKDFIHDHDATESGYICDYISEFADNNTSIYYTDIAKYISEHIDDVTDAINELGWDGCGSDLYKAGQTAEFLSIERALYNDMHAIVSEVAREYIFDNLNEDITTDADTLTDAINELESTLNNIDNNNYMSDIRDACDVFISSLQPDPDFENA